MIYRPLLLAFAIVAAPNSHGHDVGHGSPAQSHPSQDGAATTPKERAARLYFGDRVLVTQHGRKVRFYSDVLKDRVVVVNFLFTQCRDTCSLQSAKMAQVQTLLEARAEQAIHLVSISVDPEHDSPKVLNAYAQQFGAGDGWTFLTGTKENVDDVLRRLGQLAPTAASHTTLFMLGNLKTGRWIKLHPDAEPSTIAHHLEALAASKPSNAGAAEGR